MQKKYRQLPDSLRFTSVADSPDIVHAKTSYQQCSEVRRKDGHASEMIKTYCAFKDLKKINKIFDE